MRLAGKISVVTAAASGMGRAGAFAHPLIQNFLLCLKSPDLHRFAES
jgi:hypothetical protein